MGYEGIKTEYNGIAFRSRLEAKWAAFFDRVGWKYEYEPYDLPGWIPDFALIGKGNETLVEIKPFSEEDHFDKDKLTRALKGSEQWGKVDLLLLGKTIFTESATPHIGWLGEFCPEIPKEFGYSAAQYIWSEAAAIKPELTFGFASSCHTYRDRMSGFYDGSLTYANSWDIDLAWKQAGNVVQWNR